ncbi:MAG: DUF1015 domain-containing protein [Firmicutes bacterium]|nr:DUF1015 domain-containing protein [Bacillota bacterium]
MVTVKPFAALRPTQKRAAQVAALPYDVMSSAEAREMVVGNPYSFLHVDKAEIDLPLETGLYDDIVYATAAANLNKLAADGILISEDKPCYYLYRQIMDGRAQCGIVACSSVDDYEAGRVKKHELTRADKEADRIRHVDTCDAQTGPIFLAYRQRPALKELMELVMAEAPLYDFVSGGVQQTVWRIAEAERIELIGSEFAALPATYIADGHHRCASAARVCVKRRAEHPDYDGTEEFNFFLSVLFPDEQLHIMDYNRVVKDLNGYSEAEFLAQAATVFDIAEVAAEADPKPQQRHSFAMYMAGKWYKLTLKDAPAADASPVDQLDVSLLQQRLLAPILGIGDPRTDERISFIGGIRGLKELVRLVDGGAAVAFALYPTSIEELFAIADAGLIMPPKSTWFEPKLLSGLFIHPLK